MTPAPRKPRRSKKKPARRPPPPALTPTAIDQAILLMTRHLTPSATLVGAAAILEREGTDPAGAGRLVGEARRRIMAAGAIDFEYEHGLRLLRNDEQYSMAMARNDIREARQITKARGEILRDLLADRAHGLAGNDQAGDADQAADALRRAGLGDDTDSLPELVRLAIARLVEADALPDAMPPPV